MRALTRQVLVAIALAGAAATSAVAQETVTGATVVMDTDTGDVLFADNADSRQPAPALGKLMTIYLTFEAFDAGTLTPATNIFISDTAAGQPAPALGLAALDTISAGDALSAVITASANDATLVLAEFLAGSQAAFVAAMNAKARALGMTDTRFANVSGRPYADQFSTPRDMIRFALALMRTFPDRAAGLVGARFSWRGTDYESPATFLDVLARPATPGAPPSTHINRAQQSTAGGRNVIAVVWNAPSAAVADETIAAALTAAQEARPRGDDGPKAQPGTTGSGDWGLQLGAFSTAEKAHAHLAATAKSTPQLAAAIPRVEPIRRTNDTLYRAKYVGVDEITARRICGTLTAAGSPCMVIAN